MVYIDTLQIRHFSKYTTILVNLLNMGNYPEKLTCTDLNPGRESCYIIIKSHDNEIKRV